jgi:hypothetical protein
MKELKILVERDSLLPVRYKLTHEQLQMELRRSSSADADIAAWKAFTDTVESTTYVECTEEYTGANTFLPGNPQTHGKR